MNKKTIVALAAVPFLLASCIQKELPNSECDIETVSLHVDRPTDYFYHDYDTMKTVLSTETNIVFMMRLGVILAGSQTIIKSGMR